MISELIDKLNTIKCDYLNVANVCADRLSDYSYSYGSSKIVVNYGRIVIKKIFGNVPLSEPEVYKKARQVGVKNFFVNSMELGDGIYVQQKVDIPLNEFVINQAKETGHKIPYGSLREGYRQCGLQELLYRSDCVVLYYLFLKYTMEEILKFQDFVVENDIADLNFYNAGFYKDRVVFFDYSGIGEEIVN